jgi:YHS domain-containing protein
VAPLIAVLSFVGSVGNVPPAAVLWSGGISFAGVLAFLFADLIVLPIVAIYRKYYGTAFALRITALMFVTMVLAALVVALGMDLVGAIPRGPRPTRADVFSAVGVDKKLALNVLGLLIFGALFGLTVRRGVTDPVCGMKVDRARAIRREAGGRTVFFCSEPRAATFDREPSEAGAGGGRDRVVADAPEYGGAQRAPAARPRDEQVVVAFTTAPHGGERRFV